MDDWDHSADMAAMHTRVSLPRRVQAIILGALTSAVLLGAPAPAAADITAFLGASQTPKNRAAKGLAVGITVIAVGLEFEYAEISEKVSADAPRLRTGMVNALLQTPTSGAQLYATAGAGLYRESLTGGPSETSTGVNIGGGLKMGLLGPLKLRVDYRFFKLQGDAAHSKLHRVYAGVTASF